MGFTLTPFGKKGEKKYNRSTIQPNLALFSAYSLPIDTGWQP